MSICASGRGFTVGSTKMLFSSHWWIHVVLAINCNFMSLAAGSCSLIVSPEQSSEDTMDLASSRRRRRDFLVSSLPAAVLLVHYWFNSVVILSIFVAELGNLLTFVSFLHCFFFQATNTLTGEIVAVKKMLYNGKSSVEVNTVAFIVEHC